MTVSGRLTLPYSLVLWLPPSRSATGQMKAARFFSLAAGAGLFSTAKEATHSWFAF